MKGNDGVMRNGGLDALVVPRYFEQSRETWETTDWVNRPEDARICCDIRNRPNQVA